MSRLKILIVSRSFFPENSPRSFRTTELVKEFCRQGHEVKLITIKKPEQDQLIQQFGFTVKNLGAPRWKTHAVKGSGVVSFFWRAFNRIAQLLVEYPDIEFAKKVYRAVKNEKGHDLLISIAVPFPVHWGVAAARTQKTPLARTWVADCGDPYMGCKTDSFKKLFYFKYVEKWFCRKADFLAVPTKSAIEAYYPEFRSKIKVIPQGFDFSDLNFLEAYTPNPVSSFIYAGGFIQGIRDPVPFLDYLCAVKQNFQFTIFTNKEGQSLLKPYQEKLKNKLVVKDYIERKQLLYLLSKADFVINFDNNTSVQTPSKLIDYALAQRPILNITKEMDQMVIQEFLEGNYRNAYQLNSLEDHNIQNVAASFLLCVRKVQHDQSK